MRATPSRIASTSTARRASTSPSASARTAAWACIWPGWRRPWRWRRSSTACRTCAWIPTPGRSPSPASPSARPRSCRCCSGSSPPGLRDRLRLAQLADLIRREAPVSERLVGVLAGVRGRAPDLGAAAAEARSRARLRRAGHRHEGVARLDVRMLLGLGEREHRREADVAALHDLAPLVAGLALEDGGQPLLHVRPGAAVHLARQRLAREPGLLEQLLVELRLDRADRHVLPVAGLVDLVEVRAGVEHVGAALLLPPAGLVRAVDDRHQR